MVTELQNNHEKIVERFQILKWGGGGGTQELKENSENQNTKKSTSTWLNVWISWAENRKPISSPTKQN